MKMKRILAALLALCLLLSHAPAGAFAAETVASGTCGDNLTWTLDENGLLTISGEGSITEAPWLADYADSITAVVIEEGVQDICEKAFFGCKNMKEVTIPDTVGIIFGYAFAECSSLVSITIPASIRSLRHRIFENCSSLTEVMFEGNLPTCTDDTYLFLGVTATVYYPAGNTTWEAYWLKEYGGELTWVAYGDATGVISSGTCGEDLAWSLSNNGTLTISGTGPMTDYGYSSENKSPFDSNRKINRVVIEDGVTSIGAYAFYFCENLIEVSIGKDVESIGSMAFEYCEGLKSITIPSGVQTIKAHAFDWCDALEEVILCDGLVSIEKYAFVDCRALTSLTIPASVTSIDDCAFWNCISVTGFWVDAENPVYSSDSNGVLFNKDKTTLINAPNMMSGSYTVPESVTALAKTAFRNCFWLTEIIIPDSVTAIGNFAFYDCKNLAYITLPAALTEISHEMMMFCTSLKGIVIPENVAVIQDEAFMDCDALEWVIVPASVTYLDYTAFYGCSQLQYVSFAGDAPDCGGEVAFGTKTIYYPAGNETWTDEAKAAIASNATWKAVTASGACGNNLFWTLDTDGLLTVSGEGAMGNYLEDGAPWYDYIDDIKTAVIEEGVTNIGGWAFALCENMESIIIADTVTAIDEDAFWECSSLTSISLPEGLLSIGNVAFSGCDSLASITIPDSVTAIGSSAFSYCTSLTSVNIPAGVTVIDSYTFSSCTSLKAVTLPDSVTDIGYGAFSGCHSLESINIPAGVTSIGDEAFSCCFVLDHVTLPEGLTSISERLFYGCDTLSSITIPKGVTEIAEDAFLGCFDLRKVLFLGDAPTIGEDAFAETVTSAYYPAGNATWTEEVMQQYGGQVTWIAYGGETEGLFALSGTSVSLYDSLDMHFFIDPANVAEGYYAVLTRFYADGREDHVVTVPFGDWRALSDGSLYVTYSGIAAKEMGDYVEVTVYNGNGEAVSELYVDSVKSYAMRMLGKEEVTANEELRTLYVDMLNYGAAAQAQFGYNVTMPANDLLTQEQQAYATASYETEDALEKGTGRAGTALTLKNRITLDMIFTNSAIGSDHTGLYAIAAYTDHYGSEVKTRIDHVKAYGNNYGYVSVPGLAVADYGQAVTVTVYDAQGNALAWATDSIEGYAHRMAGKLPAMVEAIVKFGTSAYNYFH